MKKSTQKTKIFFRTFVAILWIFVLFFCAEFYLRYNQAQWLNNSKILQDSKRKNAFFTEAYHSSLWHKRWWEYKRNAYLVLQQGETTYEIETNDDGFRDDPITLPKPSNAIRIVCVGGSTTVEGVNNQTTYPNQVEKLLKGKVELVNCGISGLLSSGELRKMPVYLSLQPDFLLEYNCVNDICRILFSKWEKNTAISTKILRTSLFLQKLLNLSSFPRLQDVAQDIEIFILANLEKMWYQAKENKVKMIFCSFAFPDLSICTEEEKAYLDYNLKVFWKSNSISIEEYCATVQRYNELLEKFCVKNKISFIPVAKNFRGGTNYFIDICHLTPIGIQRKSQIIATYLKKIIK